MFFFISSLRYIIDTLKIHIYILKIYRYTSLAKQWKSQPESFFMYIMFKMYLLTWYWPGPGEFWEDFRANSLTTSLPTDLKADLMLMSREYYFCGRTTLLLLYLMLKSSCWEACRSKLDCRYCSLKIPCVYPFAISSVLCSDSLYCWLLRIELWLLCACWWAATYWFYELLLICSETRLEISSCELAGDSDSRLKLMAFWYLNIALCCW